MANLGDPRNKLRDTTQDLLGDWNLSETRDLPPSGDGNAKSPRSLQDQNREANKYRIDKKESRGGPHLPNGPSRHSETALYGAFDLVSRESSRGIADDRADDQGGPSRKSGLSSTKDEAVQEIRSGGSLELRLPREGEEFCGFRIILELGRGAFARVYLAEEVNLGSRLVAIKVSKAEGDEPQILARLQHTHIVPVHSVYTDSQSGCRILCMPYFGGANLAEVLESAESYSNSVAVRTGQSLIQALDRVSRQPRSTSSSNSRRENFPADLAGSASRSIKDRQNDLSSSIREALPAPRIAPSPVSSLYTLVTHAIRERFPRLLGNSAATAHDPNPLPYLMDANRPSRRFLQGASGVQAAVWIIARLAEGLEHAHARGLLHRDIKPSNVLITADGTPMLLDFNLSVEQASDDPEGSLDRAKIGGTLPYMSPEHLDAFNPRGSTSPSAVDGRSDIYALGLILFEMIAGRHPFPEPSPQRSIFDTIEVMLASRRQVPSLRAAREDVPWSLDALAAKCLHPDPNRRYASASELAEDLRRFLDNLPMKHCPDPSPKERIKKWAKRHPAISSSTSVGLISLLLVLLLGASVSMLYTRIQDVAARLRLQVFRQGFADSQFWLNTQSDRVEHINKGLSQAQETLGYVGLSEPNWGQGAGWIQRLPAVERDQVIEQAVELSLLNARARVKVAEKLGTEGDRRRSLEQAVRLINRAERLGDRPTAALFLERARFEDALGLSKLADQDRRRASEIPLSSSYDYLVFGTSLLADGRFSEAEVPLKEAIKRDVTSFWAWFGLGHCYFHLGRYPDAVSAFTACVVRGPNFAWAHFNLGLALAKSGRLIDAKAAYDRSIELDPSFPEALVNRGLVELELDQLDEARSDLERGIAAGRDEVGVLVAFGEALARMGRHEEADRSFERILERNPENPNVLVARGMSRLQRDPRGAKEDFARALNLDPAFAAAHYGIARVVRSEDPAGAIGHLDEALRTDPNLLDAVQLRALIRARLADPGTVDDVDRLLQKPTPHRVYNAACALAVYAEKSGDSRPVRRSLDLLAQAVRLGFPIREVQSDPDLAILRALPEFQKLIAETPSK